MIASDFLSKIRRADSQRGPAQYLPLICFKFLPGYVTIKTNLHQGYKPGLLGSSQEVKQFYL